MEKRKCVIDGCENTGIKAFGLCDKHYLQWRRGKVDDALLVHHPPKPQTCIVEGCDRKVVGQGYCNAHYLRFKKGWTLERMANQPIQVHANGWEQVCSVEGCERKVGVKGGRGMCSSHFKQWRRKVRWQEVIKSKGGRCERCGGVFPFTVYDLHHIDPTQKEIGVSSLMDNALDTVLREADKCILLCANCHRLEHFGDGSHLP